MKVVPFQVPQTKREAFRVQDDVVDHFYDKLHQHHEAQIMWIVQGEGTLIVGDYVGRFQPGELYIIGSNQAHVFRNDEVYYHANASTKAIAKSVFFDEKYLGEDFWQLDELSELRAFMDLAKLGLRVEGTTKDTVINLMSTLDVVGGLDKILAFFEILNSLTKSNEVRKLGVSSPLAFSNSEGKRMNDILQFTFNESHRKIYIDEVAKVANLSTEAFCRYFKLRTRKTYTNFLNEVRVSNACRLLIGKERSMQEVCFRVGFSNTSNFNRIFKKFTGKTPSSYIQKVD
ncbi:MAG: AraC family transcriptional regulator [Cyclobacteriaceae bacterium]